MEMAVILSAVFVQASVVPSSRAQSSSIPVSQEFASGDVQVFASLQAWYTWVNINGTHTIFLALHSNQGPSPVSAFVGQSYNTSSGSRVFVANALMAMEVYNDTNGNGFLDANYTVPRTELLYTIIMNASDTFATTAVQKTVSNGVPHYAWGVTYGSVQGDLIKADPAQGYGYGGGLPASVLKIDHVSLFYDYSLNGNRTFLKTSYEIGNVTLTPPTLPNVTLRGLSFSLLHFTLAVSSKQFTVLANSLPYDSQTTPAPKLVDVAQVTVQNVLAYEFLFKDNYTLLTNPAVNYPVAYAASPRGSLPPNAFQGQGALQLIRVQDYVKASLPDIAGLPETSDLNYNTSKLIYRVSYPTWSGYGLRHDPTYVAHFAPESLTGPPPPPTTPPLTILALAIFTGALSVILAVHGFSRSRKHYLPDESENLTASKSRYTGNPTLPAEGLPTQEHSPYRRAESTV